MIQRFRKKPVVIEAYRFTAEMRSGSPLLEGLTWVGSRPGEAVVYCETLEGRMEVSDGDWIVKGVKGERYPVRDDIFRLTYEPAAGTRWTWYIERGVKGVIAHAHRRESDPSACGESLTRSDFRESMAGDELCGKCRDITGDRPDQDPLKREQEKPG